MKPAFKKMVIVVVAVIALIAGALAVFDWNWLRGPVASYVGQKLERSVAINGNLHVKLGAITLIQADDVAIGNAPWAEDPTMAQTRRIAVNVDVRELVSRRIVLPEILLVEPELLLETNAAGEANWSFPPSAGGAPPNLGLLRIEKGMVHYRDPRLATDVTLDIDSDMPTAGDSQLTVRFAGSGRLHQEAFTVAGAGSALLSLRDPAKPYRIEVEARAGDSRAKFAGSFVPLQIQDIDGDLEMQGADLSKLYPVIPVPLPWTPPYRLTGHLVHTNDEWSFHNFTGKVGNSDLSGEFKLDRSRRRPAITADVTSKRLDYKDLGGFVGVPPGDKPPAGTTKEQARAAESRAASSRVLSDKPYDLERLRAVDADVRFRGEHVIARDLPFDKLDTHLELEEGELRFRPLDFGIAGGNVVSNLTIDAREETIHADADVSVRNLEMKQIFPQLKPPKGSAGKFGGRARVASSGNSVAQLLGSLDGEISLIMWGGQASTLTLVLTNLDLARAAELILRGDDSSAIRCVVAGFSANEGIMSARTIVMDTSAVIVHGEGTIDFREELYDLRLHTKSKRPSPLALRGPIVITGNFKNPDIRPAIGPVAARAGTSVALGVLATPLAALLPLIDFGGGKDSDCRALVTDAEQSVAGEAVRQH